MRIVSVFLMFVLLSCSSKSIPDNVIQPEKMVKVVSEIMQVEEFINNFLMRDSTINLKEKRSLLYEQTFKLNDITRKDFYSSLKYYQQHPDIQKALFDSVHNSMDSTKPLIKQKSGK